jgi:hypothetical protein
MKKRRSKGNFSKEVDTSQLDIFLDVLMNSVGIFMLIAMILALQINVAQRLILQVNRSPKENKKAYFFEIRDNEIIDLTETRELVNQRIDQLYVRQAACSLEPFEEYQTCLNEVINEFETFQVQTASYQVQVDWEKGNFLYQPIDSNVSSSEQQGDVQKVTFVADDDDSEFTSYLENNQINPEEYYLVFITRPSGFSTYSEVRDIAVNNNYEVGWEPYPYRQPIIFSASGEGRQVGVQ